MILYTADLHLGHKNIIRMDHRPFASVDEMEEYLVSQWNFRVQDDDEVYIVGDFCYKSGKQPQEYLRRLRGKKHLIIGNHDTALLKNKTAMSYFSSVNDILTINDNGRQVVMCHYPFAEWPHYFRGAYHVYGHIHNNTGNNAYGVMCKEEKALNAGCMINNYAPASLNELIRNNETFKKYGFNRRA